MTPDDAITWFFGYTGRLIAVGGGGAAVAYALFRWFGTSWLDQQFKKRLEELKHDHQRELEQLRHEINALFSRISRIHEKEFEVLPKAWYLLHVAHGTVFQLVKPFKQFPDFDNMPAPQFEAFLARCRLAEFQRDELRNATDRLKYYQRAIYYVEFDDAKKAETELNNYLAVNSIFMTDDLRKQFRTINEGLQKVLVNEEIGRGAFSSESEKSKTEAFMQVTSMFNEIEAAVQKRLRYNEA